MNRFNNPQDGIASIVRKFIKEHGRAPRHWELELEKCHRPIIKKNNQVIIVLTKPEHPKKEQTTPIKKSVIETIYS